MAHLGHLGYDLADHRMICFGSKLLHCICMAGVGGPRHRERGAPRGAYFGRLSMLVRLSWDNWACVQGQPMGCIHM